MKTRPTTWTERAGRAPLPEDFLPCIYICVFIFLGEAKAERSDGRVKALLHLHCHRGVSPAARLGANK